MVRRHLRTKGTRKVRVKTATGVTIHYKQKKINRAKCGTCKKTLHGIPSLTKAKFRNLTSSQRKVARKYGGNLCSSCARKKIVEEARALIKK